MKSKHATLLNALAEMQASPAYAARRGVLQQAEELIVRLEQELNQLKGDVEPSSQVHYRGLKINDTVKVHDATKSLGGKDYSGRVGAICALGEDGGVFTVTVQFSEGDQLHCRPTELTFVSREE